MALRCMVVIPTYNEVDNVQALVPRVLQFANFQVLVVDDGSPDGTAAEVRRIAEGNPRVHLLERPRKMGLGSAYIAGFRYALERDFDVIFEMDADFSHDPAALPEFEAAIERHDLVLGSRYLYGVTVVNWPLRRLILSYCANVYARVLTGVPIHDLTGGFKAFRREVLEAIDLSRIRSDGYSFQVEMTFHCARKGFRVCEIPIIFADRRVGISKMNKRIIWEAIWMIWRLFALRLFTRERQVGVARTEAPAPRPANPGDAEHTAHASRAADRARDVHSAEESVFWDESGRARSAPSGRSEV